MIIGTVAERVGRTTGIYTMYLEALARAGATPILITPTQAVAELDAVWNAIDGLLLAGGGDIETTQYGQTPSATLDSVDPVRDEIELIGTRRMQAAGKRVLGVCRGAQLLAVAAGGSLVQDLPAAGVLGHREHRFNRTYAQANHALKVERDSVTEQVLDGLDAVNSEHHQAIAVPGRGLVATAWSLDGSIEAVEGDGVLGVQWHPEFLIDEDSRHLRPFSWLVYGQEGLSA